MKTIKHNGDLTITTENQGKYKNLKEVSGYIYVSKNATLDAPNLEKSGSIQVSENATLDAPNLKEVSGYIDVRENATLDAPNLEKSGSIQVSENATLDAPNLKEVSGYIDVRENATLDAPNLEKSGSIQVSENATLDAPNLKEVSGSIYVSENATLDAPNLKVKNNVATFNRIEHKICLNDGITFFSERQRTSKGIKIHEGLTELKMANGKLTGTKTFLVEKEGFSAHGKTLKKAISDLQFKIVSEKLKNEPIYEDTEMTVKHYRLITGACDIGCRSFMERHGIPFEIINEGTDEEETVEKEPISAKQLFPILEKSNAYGFERFRKLVTF